MRIDQLPALPAGAGTAKFPCSYNGADYVKELETNPSVLVYQSGDQINDSLFGFGYVTTDAKQLTFICLTPKMFGAGAAVSATSVLAAVRAVGGGYIANAIGADLTSKVTSVVCSGCMLIFTITKSTAWTYGSGGTSSGTVTNNTPVAGYLTVQLTVS